ncbi:MAG: S-layer homology domain-containing protein [Clostridia bacterium]|nr:S-layer homology domain-containing protein [Clostridia bacterium]
MKRYGLLLLVFLLCFSCMSMTAAGAEGVSVYSDDKETTLTGQEGSWPFKAVTGFTLNNKKVIYESKIQISGTEGASNVFQIHAGFSNETVTGAYVNLFNFGTAMATTNDSQTVLAENLSEDTWYHVKLELNLIDCTYKVTLSDDSGTELGHSDYASLPANSKGLTYPGANLIGFRMMRGTSKAAHTLKMKEMRVAYLPDESDPAISGLKVGGNPYIGKTVSADYSFTAYPGEGDSLYQWYSCDTADGVFSPIAGQTGKTLALTEDMLGIYVKVQVTPKNTRGDQGEAVLSNAVLVREEPDASFIGVTVYSRPAEITYTGQEGAWPYLGITDFSVPILSDDILVNTDLMISDGGTDYTGDIGLVSLGFTDGANKGFTHVLKITTSQVKNSSGTAFSDFAPDLWYHVTVKVNMEAKTYQASIFDESGNLVGESEQLSLPAINGVDQSSSEFMGVRLMRATSKAEHSISLRNVIVSYLPLPTAPEAKAVSISGEAIIGQTVKGTYTYLDVNGDREAGTTFRWLRSDEENGTYAPIPGAESQTYQVTQEDQGKYLKFEVTPRSAVAPKEGTGTVSPALVGPTAPTVSSVTIKGKMALGESLEASYLYGDKNNDPEGETVVTWLRSTDGGFQEVGSGKSYTLTEGDIGAKLKISVTPVSVHPPFAGTAVESQEITGPCRPLAKDVAIDGVAAVDQLLTASYTYEDPNGFDSAGENWQWYVSDTQDGAYTPIDQANDSTYRISQQNYGKYLKVGVIPKKTEQPAEGQETYSLPIGPVGEKATAAAPEARNVMIEGMPYVGQTLTGSYTYYDINEDPQEGTTFRWLISSSEDGAYLPIEGAEGIQWEIPGDAVGKYVKFEVTPRSSVEPKEGQPVLSEAVKIQVASTFFVAPNGSDENEGSKEKPFLTVERARDAIRELKKNSGLPEGGITVYLREGQYRLTSPLLFTEEDSGTENAPIRYRAYRDEKVVLNGGVSLNGMDFSRVSSDIAARLPSADAKNKVVQFDLKSAGITDYGIIYPQGSVPVEYYENAEGPCAPELFVNGSRMTLARYPNEGYTTIKRVIDPGDYVRMWADDKKSDPGYVPEDQRHYPPRGAVFEYSDNRVENWMTYEDVWLNGYFGADWSNAQVAVKAVDKTAKTISTVHASNYSYIEGKRYYYLNVLDELDIPGEWYLDRNTGMLYLYPETDSFEQAEVTLSLLEDDLIQATNVSYLTFKGLTVEAGRANGITISGNYNTVDGCTVTQLAGGGVTASGVGNTVKNCEISHTGSFGASINGGDRNTLTPGNNMVENCLIHDWGVLMRTYQCGIHVNGVGNRAIHNELYEAPHIAILYGGNDNEIAYNVIHDVCQETTDAAAIYSGRDWTAQGNQVNYNYLYHLTHDVAASFGPFGIYFDDALSGQTAVGNILVDVKDRGFHIGGGRDHVVENNIFIRAKYPISYDDRGRSLPSYFIACMDPETGTMWQRLKAVPYTSDIWKQKYPTLANVLTDQSSDKDDPDWPGNPSYSSVRNNVAVDCTVPAGLISKSVYTYSTVENNISYKTDPGFVDAANGNYNLKPDSQIFTDLPEFQAIPFDQIGRYGVTLSAPPSASDAKIMGQGYVDNTIKASYRFYDPEGDEEGESVIRWYSSASAEGDYRPISGAVGKELVITGDLVGKYLKFEVTPYDETGAAGEAVWSASVFVTVDESSFRQMIEYAQKACEEAVEGTLLGQYPAGSKAALMAAIEAAQAFYEEGASGDLEAASEALSQAYDSFCEKRITSVTVSENAQVSVPAGLEKAEIQTDGTRLTLLPEGEELPDLKITVAGMTVEVPQGCTLTPGRQLAVQGPINKTVDYEECKELSVGEEGQTFSKPLTLTIEGAAGMGLYRVTDSGLQKIEELTENSFSFSQGGTYLLGVFAPKSDNADLSGITVNGKAVPKFSADKTEYNYFVPAETGSVTVEATPSHERAQVSLVQPGELPCTVEITVTAEDRQTVKTYQLKLAYQKGETPTDSPEPVINPPASGSGSSGPITAVIAAGGGSQQNSVYFSDITGHWAEKDIIFMAQKNIVSGVTQTSFEPDRPITRAEFAAITVRALGISSSVSAGFTDVAPGAWYEASVNAAAGAGLIAGYEGMFRPEDQITREEMAVIIAKAYAFRGKTVSNAGKLDFQDAEEISAWAYDSVAAVSTVGLIRGNGNGQFCPKNNATRAECTSLIRRLLDA